MVKTTITPTQRDKMIEASMTLGLFYPGDYRKDQATQRVDHMLARAGITVQAPHEDTTLERRLIVNTESILGSHEVIVEVEPDVWVWETWMPGLDCTVQPDPYDDEIVMLLDLSEAKED